MTLAARDSQSLKLKRNPPYEGLEACRPCRTFSGASYRTSAVNTVDGGFEEGEKGHGLLLRIPLKYE